MKEHEAIEEATRRSAEYRGPGAGVFAVVLRGWNPEGPDDVEFAVERGAAPDARGTGTELYGYAVGGEYQSAAPGFDEDGIPLAGILDLAWERVRRSGQPYAVKPLLGADGKTVEGFGLRLDGDTIYSSGGEVGMRDYRARKQAEEFAEDVEDFLARELTTDEEARLVDRFSRRLWTLLR